MQKITSPEIWDSLQRSNVDLFASEENATFWLWAYPSLLGWHRRFEWLFSPVVGNTKYPGDLWGIDEAGNLLLVETKLGRRCDPFKDFIEYEREHKWEESAGHDQLYERWKSLYESERCFWKNHGTNLSNRKLDEITARGVVPYSSKRYASRQWSVLYVNVMVPYLFGEEAYVVNVDRFLKARIQLAERTIHYCGLIFVKDTGLATLSAKGEDHFRELKTLAGKDRVNLMCMTAMDSPIEHCVHLQCERLTTDLSNINSYNSRE